MNHSWLSCAPISRMFTISTGVCAPSHQRLPASASRCLSAGSSRMTSLPLASAPPQLSAVYSLVTFACSRTQRNPPVLLCLQVRYMTSLDTFIRVFPSELYVIQRVRAIDFQYIYLYTIYNLRLSLRYHDKLSNWLCDILAFYQLPGIDFVYTW